jgi:hypothetical protein
MLATSRPGIYSTTFSLFFQTAHYALQSPHQEHKCFNAAGRYVQLHLQLSNPTSKPYQLTTSIPSQENCSRQLSQIQRTTRYKNVLQWNVLTNLYTAHIYPMQNSHSCLPRIDSSPRTNQLPQTTHQVRHQADMGPGARFGSYTVMLGLGVNTYGGGADKGDPSGAPAGAYSGAQAGA